MTYTLGDRRITLEAPDPLLVAHPTLLKHCLNDASLRLLTHLKWLVHLYCDTLVIYRTLLSKVPKYDDVTLLAANTLALMLDFEALLNRVLGDFDGADAAPPARALAAYRRGVDWTRRNYNRDVRRLCLLCVQLARERFALVVRCLNCVEVFFEQFDNLKKLLIPFLLAQALEIEALLARLCGWYLQATVVDDPPVRPAAAMHALRAAERVTSGVERELVVFSAAFTTFDHLLQLYTAILLGRAILKRDIGERQCRIFERREVCSQAAEHVVNIPLHQDRSAHAQLARYLAVATFVGLALVAVVAYRLMEVLL
jgi:hypothetical protein